MTCDNAEYWYPANKFDARAVGLYRRHYSATTHRHGLRIDHLSRGIAPPGEDMILLTLDCKALFGWIKQQFRKDKQIGVNCFVFRNEGNILSSDLITEAMTLAKERWPGERLFTFVDPLKVKSSNPGYCFIQAGWRKCGRTKGGLLILDYFHVR